MANRRIILALPLILFLPYTLGDVNAVFALIVGLILGYVIQRSRFCFTASIRDYFLFESTALLKTLLLILIFTLCGFFAVQNILPLVKGLPVGIFKPIGLHTLVGAIIFGIGMTLGGGCILGVLVRLGEGFIINILILLAIFVGIYLGIWNYPFWQKLVPISSNVYLGNYLGQTGAFVASLSILSAFLAWIIYKERSFGEIPEYVAVTSDIQPVWSPVKTALVLATLNTIFLIVTRIPISLTNGLSRWVGSGLIISGINIKKYIFFQMPQMVKEMEQSFFGVETFLIIGIIIGSYITAVYFGEFRTKPIRSMKQVLIAVTGGLLIGYGARIGMGCTISALVSGVASMSVHGWIFAIFLPVGVMIGVKILQKII